MHHYPLAYLDPSSGSMVFQMVVGGLLATAGVLRLYWSKLRGIFGDNPQDQNRKS
jgi:hypothetical protein